MSTAATSAKSPNNAEKEVFQKTFAFFIALQERGCTFDHDENNVLEPENGTSEMDITDDTFIFTEDGLTTDQYLDEAGLSSQFNLECSPLSRRPVNKSRCQRKLVMNFDKFNQPYIQ